MHPSFLHAQWKLISVLTLIGSLLAGCISTNPVMLTKFYILNPTEYDETLAAEINAKDPLSLEIASLRLPQYLEKPQIVVRSSGNRIEMAEYHQWGGNLRKNMSRVLAQNISYLLDTPNIAIAPYRPLSPPSFSIELTVMRFERDSNGQVKFFAQWRLSRGRDGKPLVTQMIDLTSPVVDVGSDFEQIVSAMSTLLGDVSLIISKQIINDTSKVPSE
jgi:uncharacterized lipoprotein YmbA